MGSSIDGISFGLRRVEQFSPWELLEKRAAASEGHWVRDADRVGRLKCIRMASKVSRCLSRHRQSRLQVACSCSCSSFENRIDRIPSQLLEVSIAPGRG